VLLSSITSTFTPLDVLTRVSRLNKIGLKKSDH
jgi:hypothetical protein